MSRNVFIPKINGLSEEEKMVEAEGSEGVVVKSDHVVVILQKISQYTLIVLFGLIPVFFVPGLWASLGFDKTFIALGLGVVIIVATALTALRSKQAKTVIPFSLVLFWLLVLVAIISGLFSGDVQDSVRGSVLDIQTAGFIGVMAVIMTVSLVLQQSKLLTIKALAFFSITASILLVYNLLRIFIGADFLTLGSFGSLTISPIGSLNDLGILAGLMIIFGLITLAQLPIKKVLQYIIFGLIVVSLIILAIVNFFNVWLVVGFFALLMLIYQLSKDTLFGNPEEPAAKKNFSLLLTTTALVCLASATFIVSGEYVGSKINQSTDINYFEVKPTISTTIDVAKSVYGTDMLLGVGPNRFSDAWRLHKDSSINQTIFWDTDFTSGSGYVPTFFVNLGLLGGILMVVFNIYFLYLGYKMLLRSNTKDSYWHYFGAVSFAAATFVWGMSYVYVPGAGILLLGAFFTGLTFVAAGSLLPQMVRTVPLASNRQRGFFLMAAIILIVTTSIGVLFTVGKQYIAQSQFSKAQVTAKSVPEFEKVAVESFGLYPDNRFGSIIAQLKLSEMVSLLGLNSPTEQQQKQFLTTADQAIILANQLTETDPTNPENQVILAGVYSNLAIAGAEGAKERALSSLTNAQNLDPYNPKYHLISAQLLAQIGDIELAREEIEKALAIKPNFTQALFLLTQIDIGAGNVESAIETAKAIITLEPNNATRYFQLGVLLAANENLLGAITAYQQAIVINPDYANARYLLALAYLNDDKSELALEQLKIVKKTNQENVELGTLIKKVEAGEDVVTDSVGFNVPVNEKSPSVGVGDAVTTDGETNTELVTPVNTVSDEAGSDETDTLNDETVTESGDINTETNLESVE